MKKISSSIGFWLLASGMLFAQGEMDAFRFSQKDLNGTARSMSMGGAFGALGGDMSAMSHNPAGIAVYRSSEVQATMNLHSASMSSIWTGMKDSENKTRFNFDNFSYVGYFPTGQVSGLKSWNIAFAYNRIKNFNRSYSATGTPQFSLADFAATYASNVFGDEGGVYLDDLKSSYPYDNNPWLPVLGYQSGFFVPKDENNGKNDIYYNAFDSKPSQTRLRVNEKGSMNEYNFSFGANVSDFLFLGGTMAIVDVNYRMSSYHDEKYQGGDYLYLDNYLDTEGTGYSFNLGAIVRPIDQLRFGVAYNSPKWYRMTDSYYAEGGSRISTYDDPLMKANTPKDAAPTEYNLRTPDRWIFSVAGILGKTALISFDYELMNYKSMRLYDSDWSAKKHYSADNKYIREDFKVDHTIKLGGEVKVTPQFAVRGGYVWQGSPMNKTLTSSNPAELNMISPVGTISHYTVLNSTNHYTVGIGYRFTPNFYMDLGCIYRVQNEKLYSFSNTFWEDSGVGIHKVTSDPAKISAKTTRVLLSMGYKF